MKKISEKAFISKHCFVSGNVEIADNVSVWPMAVIRADIEPIIIGENSNVQDGSIIHPNHGKPVIVGKNVTIGHNAIVHDCTIGDNCLIGMGAILLDGVVVEDDCVIAAGSIVLSGKVVSKGSLWMGAPAKFFRNTNENDLQHALRNAKEYVDLAKQARDNKDDFI